MSKIKTLLLSVVNNAVVRKDAKDLVKVIVGVLLAHYGIKAS
jgi:hypothetical protein